MIRKCIFLLSVVGFCLFSVDLIAQETVNDPIETHEDNKTKNDSLMIPVELPMISPFIELLGKGFISVNVDFRLKEAWAISFGFQPSDGVMPDFMLYHLSGERRRFEAGGGLSAGFANDLSLEGFIIHGVIGYRYQKKKGLFLRVGFTPMYTIFLDESGRNKFYPLGGFSAGYSF